MAVGLGVASALLRIPHVRDPFWQDEVASARILGEPTLGRLLAHVARTESTPPLWYVAAWLLHRLGLGLMEIRMLSVACGALLAALVVVAARRVAPLGLATLAGLLVAVGGQLSFASRELRAYALLALLSLAYALALEARRRKLLVLVTAAGLLTHYFFVFTLGAGLLWLWLDASARTARVRMTAAICVGSLLAAPWLPYALRQYRQDRYAWIGSFDTRVVVNTPLRLFTPLLHGEWAPLLFLALVVAGAWRLTRISSFGRLFAACALTPIVGAGALWLAGVDVYAVRNLIGAAPFLAVNVASAFALAGRRVRVAAAAAVACAAVAGFTWEQLQPAAPYARIAGTLVSEGWRPGDPVLVFGSPYAFRSPLEWYLPREPRLAVLRLRRPSCQVGFVVAGGRARRAIADDVLGARTVGRFIVARARLDDATSRSASLLGTRRARHRCERRFSA